jgi:hypothetical protein
MLKTKSVYEQPPEAQLEALLAQDPQLLPAAVVRRMLDETPLTEGEKIEQRICSLFICLYRLKYAPDLEDEWRLLIEQHYSEQLSVLAKQLIRREQRNQLAELEVE